MEQVGEEKKEAGMATPTVSMKLLVDTKAKRVLFAEAGKECVDFLFQLLSLPVATVIRVLGAEGMGMEGSWANLYESLKDLNETYIEAGKSKDGFLKPVSPVSCSSVPLLALESAAAPRFGKFFYTCGSNPCLSGHFSDDPRTICPKCFRSMNILSGLTYVAPPGVQVASEGGGLVKGIVTYMVMDDLEVKPMSTISSIALLNKLNVTDIGILEEKVVQLGRNEALMLLKASHHSKNVLTEVFL